MKGTLLALLRSASAAAIHLRMIAVSKLGDWRAALVLLVVLAPAGPAAAAEARSRFGYCAPPFPPPCVAAASRNGGATAACEKEVERYVASVFSYRGCLASETERAVREANATIQTMRCAKDASLCPMPEPEAEAPRGKSAKKPKGGR